METSSPPSNPPPTSLNPKKGLGTGAKVGIGCGAVALLIILGLVIFTVIFAPKMKKLAEDMAKNPTRATATMMVSTGVMEMVAEDDANKRYTVKDPKSGVLTTIYWDETKKAPVVIPGDFSAIPVTPPPAAP